MRRVCSKGGGIKTQQSAWQRAAIVSSALLAVLPLFLHGPSCGHDFDFHLQSWFAASSAWKSGVLYPHWVAAANYGAGEPRFVFYPPLSWALGALVGAGVPWTWVPQAFTFLALSACGLAFRRLARHWVRSSVATAAACVYLANPYLLFVAYERTAYGELLGAITMPLVVLFTLRERTAVLPLALTVAALWLTNAPSAVMGCYLLAFCAATTAPASRSVWPALRSLTALVLGTGLAGVYVVPAWYEQRWVEIARVTGPGMRVEDSFLFGHTGEAFHDQVLHTASSISVAVLAAGLLCAAAGRLALRMGRASHPAPAGGVAGTPLARLYPVLTVGLLAILLLLLPVSDPVWRFAPELHFLQFPWRWLLVASLLSTLAGAAAAESIAQAWRPSRRPRLTAMTLAGLFCANAWGAGLYAQHHFAQACDEEDNVAAQQTLLAPPTDETAPSRPAAAPAGFEGTDEYTPSGADNGEIQQDLPAVRLLLAPGDDEGDDSVNPNPSWQPTPSQGAVSISDWSPEHKRLSVTAPAPRFAVLRLMDYPAWQVRLNGRTLSEHPHREDGLLTIPVPAGVSTIEIRYRATADVYAGRLLSLLSLGALAGWVRLSRPRA